MTELRAKNQGATDRPELASSDGTTMTSDTVKRMPKAKAIRCRLNNLFTPATLLRAASGPVLDPAEDAAIRPGGVLAKCAVRRGALPWAAALCA